MTYPGSHSVQMVEVRFKPAGAPARSEALWEILQFFSLNFLLSFLRKIEEYILVGMSLEFGLDIAQKLSGPRCLGWAWVPDHFTGAL